jgi:hypothetical protein
VPPVVVLVVAAVLIKLQVIRNYYPWYYKVANGHLQAPASLTQGKDLAPEPVWTLGRKERHLLLPVIKPDSLVFQPVV